MKEPRVPVMPNPNAGDPPPFNKMSGDAFEEMCCALLAKEPGIGSADLFGRPREPQYGVDAIGAIKGNSGIIVVSCKCYCQIRSGHLSQWSGDFLSHWDVYWRGREVRRFVLAVAADVKASARQSDIAAEKLRSEMLGIDYEVWPPRLLQEKLRAHPGLVGQFLGTEWVPRLCGISGLSLPSPGDLLEQRWMYCQACEFDKAADCAEEAARLAREVNDKKTLIKALISAARDLGNFIVTKRLRDSEARRFLDRIASCLVELDTLDVSEAELSLEKSLFARLENRPDAALHFAEIAEANTEDSNSIADALVVQLQAYWQMGKPAEALALRERIRLATSRLERDNSMLVLQSSWLRTLRKACACTLEDVHDFIALVREMNAGDRASSMQALVSVDEVVSEFGRAGDLGGARLLLDVALELAIKLQDPFRIAIIAPQIAEVEAEFGDESVANKYLGIADQWIDRLKSGDDRLAWGKQRAMVLAARGKIYARLARTAVPSDFERSLQYYTAAYVAFKEAVTFVDEREVNLVGDIGPFRAELLLRLGDSATTLGKRSEASGYYRRARAEHIMVDERCRDLGLTSWMREVDALLFSGKPDEARSILLDLVKSPWVTDALRTDARRNIKWIDEHVVSVRKWFSSGSADEIAKIVASEPEGLRHVIAREMRPLVGWFQEFSPKGETPHAYAELVDVWGRGGFSRIVAAVRADPLNAICVDATCIEDIKLWARVFCPLYEVVVVNWKGPLDAGMAIVPMPDNLGPPGECGGQGYVRTSDTLVGRDSWHAAIGWGNFLPKSVAEFLATDAVALIKSGRLVLVPGPLVGCTQTAVGWTDNLLVDSLMGGVVKSGGVRRTGRDTTSDETGGRLLDLGAITVPFIDNVSLWDLDQILDDTTEWRYPLRRLLQVALGGTYLRQERWDSLRPYFMDIREAFRQLDERWRALMASYREGPAWRVAGLSGAFSAGARVDAVPGSDTMTDLLRSIAGGSADLGPWIPFWALREAGGQIAWTTPLDNRSTPPDEMARAQGFSSPTSQGWLFPGDGGPGMASAWRR